MVELLATGVSPRGSAMGPMAEVVYRSTQYLTRGDLHAIAVFLKSLPQARAATEQAQARAAVLPSLEAGRKIYERECVDCHGEDGKGEPGAYPALAGNRAVTMSVPANVIRIVLSGGYLPATVGNPRPYGMPPFAHVPERRRDRCGGVERACRVGKRCDCGDSASGVALSAVRELWRLSPAPRAGSGVG